MNKMQLVTICKILSIKFMNRKKLFWESTTDSISRYFIDISNRIENACNVLLFCFTEWRWFLKRIENTKLYLTRSDHTRGETRDNVGVRLIHKGELEKRSNLRLFAPWLTRDPTQCSANCWIINFQTQH